MAERSREAEALARIEAAHKEGTRQLDLSDCGLTVLPDAIGNFITLEKLDLQMNELTALPDAIGDLVSLKTLYLSDNHLTALPDAIGNLAELKTFEVAINKLAAVPDAIGNLSALNFLSLWDNRLTALPDVIGNLASLELLYLWENQLTALPDTIGNLSALENLDLSENKLTAVPDAIGNLSALENLDLSDNQLKALPGTIVNLMALESLFLHGNDALAIPPEILGTPWHEVGNENPATPPADILRYYFRSRAETRRALNEAKIILVGQGGVGKSSLVKRLIHDEFDEKEPKTEGIDIISWSLPTDTSVNPVRLNIWDFGGQEIMHATHRFFLTQRSLYLLVLDARKGANESNIQYWLEIIQSYGGDSPVLVVVNKSDEHELSLDKTRLQLDFGANLRGFFPTSAKTGVGVDTLQAAIAEQLGQLKHIRDEVPESYFSAKQELETLARDSDYVAKARYAEICEKHGVTDEQDQRILLRFLHDLGNVLNFDNPDDDFHLQDTNILNPEWVTGGVYRIVNDRDLVQAGGVLERSDIERILGGDDRYPPERHEFIIEMMRKFELCFDFPDTNDRRLLVPELLNPNEPNLGEGDGPALKFQYAYNVLPGGILPRFIVRMSHALTKPPIYWRNGVVLDIDGNRATVRADTHANQIFVSVEGPENARRHALSVIRDGFKAIHATISKLGVKEKVPMPDDSTILVNYEHLLKLEENREPDYWPEGASQKYRVQDLLNGVEDPKRREDERERRRERGERFDGKPRRRALTDEAPANRAERSAWAYLMPVAIPIVFIGVLAGLWKFIENTGAFVLIVSAALVLSYAAILVTLRRADFISQKTFQKLSIGILDKIPALSAANTNDGDD